MYSEGVYGWRFEDRVRPYRAYELVRTRAGGGLEGSVLHSPCWGAYPNHGITVRWFTRARASCGPPASVANSLSWVPVSIANDGHYEYDAVIPPILSPYVLVATLTRRTYSYDACVCN